MSQVFQYTTLDVFTSRRFSGNPLAIVQVLKGHNLTQEQKQSIAREFNFSETVFLHVDEEGSDNSQTKIDIFTTTEELPFAGHPTIGSACFFMNHIAANASASTNGEIITKSGPIPITYDSSTQIATANIPHDVHIHSRSLPSSSLFKCQPRLATNSLQLPAEFPVVSIVRGMTFVLIELPSTEMLEQVQLSADPLAVDLDEGWGESFVGGYFFVKQSQAGNRWELRTRMIDGLLEDPATGSAASTLAAFLAIHSKSPNTDFEIKIKQGIEMGRPSEIGLQVRTNGAGSGVETVTLTGQAVVITEGKLWV
ncbi:hypothetical protein HWV62_42797 [Athelia sp. TMB]|nr:hypothetical protein HWV62_720 [Athelia sp. TMB]KAF7979356.1 hypothetical protein HWV62_42797 [Athelia sp. TMB]